VAAGIRTPFMGVDGARHCHRNGAWQAKTESEQEGVWSAGRHGNRRANVPPSQARENS